MKDVKKLDINAVCFGILFNFTPVCGEERAKEEAELVRKLQAENEKLRGELEQVKRERDAAASDLESVMAYRGDNLDTCQFCKNGQCHVRGGTKQCLPQWRGPKEG